MRRVREAASAKKVLAGPTLASWKPQFEAAGSEGDDEFSYRATVTDLEVNLYGSPGDKWAIGLARLGAVLPAEPASGSGCKGGSWYKVSGGAYACSADGLEIRKASEGPVELSAEDASRVAKLERPQPFHYIKVKLDGVPRLSRLPDKDELEELDEAREAGRGASDIVQQWLNGTYLLALARKIKVGDVEFYETVAGRYIRDQDLLEKPTPPMHGEKLGGKYHLPMAFAHEESELYCTGKSHKKLRVCGKVEKHARFNVIGHLERDGVEYLLGPKGIAVARDKVRLVEKIERPDGVGDDDKWINVNLSQQALVAYEGDTPVYATLVSTGLPTHATPDGLYQVERKYTSKTMRGHDDNGPYEVQEVPWTMYYHDNYALHGAYWHDRFGKTKSHGCTNIPPADARWLYHWGELELPEGWYAMFHKRGTYVYNTGTTPPEMPE